MLIPKNSSDSILCTEFVHNNRVLSAAKKKVSNPSLSLVHSVTRSSFIHSSHSSQQYHVTLCQGWLNCCDNELPEIVSIRNLITIKFFACCNCKVRILFIPRWRAFDKKYDYDFSNDLGPFFSIHFYPHAANRIPQTHQNSNPNYIVSPKCVSLKSPPI